MKLKRTQLLTAIGALVCSLALLVGGTYALFTDEAKITNHMQSGTMELTLVRTNYKHMLLDEEGFISDVTPTGSTQYKDFSDPTEENLFGLSDDSLFAPGSSVSANLTISNQREDAVDANITDDEQNDTSSNVAFGWWLELEILDMSADRAENLKKALTVTVSIDGQAPILASLAGDETTYVLKPAAGGDFIGILPVGGAQNFTITVDYDTAAGNETETTNIKFDVIVKAVQVTEKPTP